MNGPQLNLFDLLRDLQFTPDGLGLDDPSQEHILFQMLNCGDNDHKKQVVIFNLLVSLQKEGGRFISADALKCFKKKCEKIGSMLRRLTSDTINYYIRICASCGKEHIKYTVPKCESCKAVYYCNPVCQRTDWEKNGPTSHKSQCPILKELHNKNNHESDVSENESGDGDGDGDGSENDSGNDSDNNFIEIVD